MVFQVEEMIRWADKDGDGFVGIQEFTNIMQGAVRRYFAGQQVVEESTV